MIAANANSSLFSHKLQKVTTCVFTEKHVQSVLSKVDDFATFKKVEVHTKNSTF